jgi:hypothetical protein
VADQAIGDGPGRLDHALVDPGHVDGQIDAERGRHRCGGVDHGAVEATLVLERSLVQAQQTAKQRHELLHARGRVLAVEPVPVALHAARPGAQPEDQPAAGERVQVARLRGQHQGGAPERVSDRGAQRDALGCKRDGGQRDRGRVVGELGGPDRVEAGPFGQARRLHRFVDPGQGEDEAERAHGGRP